MLLLLALALSGTARALSSWYTPPGGPPTGSNPGDKIRGVNLGGWFILWTYCSILGKEECLSRLEKHWDTYVTEDDFKRFSDYSLNTVRIPIGYWAWTKSEDFEPYVQNQLPHLEKALRWASQYGLDVMMDLHGLPGGQNGQDNQGVKGVIEFQANSTNMDRAMSALANMTETVTANRFDGVVKAIELTNEPYIREYHPNGMDFDTLADFYVQGYNTVRASEYIASGSKEVMVVIHDAFQPLLNWNYFWSEPTLGLNWTNYALDTHFYDAFGSNANKTPQEHLDAICSLSSNMAAAQAKYPVIVGEFSLGTGTYCVDYQSCFGGSLGDYIGGLTHYESSLFLRQFWEVQANVYELASGWIFWSHSNQLGAPWSWSQSAAQNWIPEDPTEKVWPFNPDVASYCLDTARPIAGNQTLPQFPAYANNVSNIDITLVQPKNAAAGTNTTSANTTSIASTSSSSESPSASAASSSTSSPPSTALADLAATSSPVKSGADGRAVPSSLLGLTVLGALSVLSHSIVT